MKMQIGLALVIMMVTTPLLTYCFTKDWRLEYLRPPLIIQRAKSSKEVNHAGGSYESRSALIAAMGRSYGKINQISPPHAILGFDVARIIDGKSDRFWLCRWHGQFLQAVFPSGIGIRPGVIGTERRVPGLCMFIAGIGTIVAGIGFIVPIYDMTGYFSNIAPTGRELG